MIVLHEPKIIVLKARKVGGTSLEIALSRFATETSIITPITKEDEETRTKLGYRPPQNFRYSPGELSLIGKFKAAIKGELPAKFFNHIPAELAKERLGGENWDSYTKIATMRNPFDSAISLYFWWQRSRPAQKGMDFETWVIKNADLISRNEEIYKIDGQQIIDFMVRYDRLEADIKKLEELHPSVEGLWETFSKINAKGAYRPKSASMEEMFRNSPRAHSLIMELFRNDIDAYDFARP